MSNKNNTNFKKRARQGGVARRPRNSNYSSSSPLHSSLRAFNVGSMYCKISINVNNICFNHWTKPAIFRTRVTTL